MILQLYNVLDNERNEFVMMIPITDDITARRSFERLFKTGEIMRSIPDIKDYPAKFDVYKVGNWNQENGIVTNYDNNEFLLNFNSFIRSNLENANQT